MNDTLPYFRYHPNPRETGMVEPSDTRCVCCGQARGFTYVGPVYAIAELDDLICPWCIADGSAAAKFDASFVDSYPLSTVGLNPDIVEEVCTRTPGYVSWQQESWLHHCNDACEFHGDATENDIKNVSAETKAEWMREYSLSEQIWSDITSNYQPGGDPAIYKFICRHCKLITFGWDCS